VRLAIHTLGTRGDVQPYVALTRGLQEAVYEIVLAPAARFETFVTAQGIPFWPLPDDFLDLMDTLAGRAALSRRNTLTWTLRRLVREVRPMMRCLQNAQWAAAQGAAAIIYHPKALGSVHLAERLDIPAFLAFTLPEMIPTRAFPNPMLPFANHGFFDRLSHELFLRYANGLYRNQSIVVTEAIMSAVNDPEMHRPATELGARIREEDGVGRAVEPINRGFVRLPVSAKSCSRG
jgi:sterol 3beta-glucosyltransferase